MRVPHLEMNCTAVQSHLLWGFLTHQLHILSAVHMLAALGGPHACCSPKSPPRRPGCKCQDACGCFQGRFHTGCCRADLLLLVQPGRRPRCVQDCGILVAFLCHTHQSVVALRACVLWADFAVPSKVQKAATLMCASTRGHWLHALFESPHPTDCAFARRHGWMQVRWAAGPCAARVLPITLYILLAVLSLSDGPRCMLAHTHTLCSLPPVPCGCFHAPLCAE